MSWLNLLLEDILNEIGSEDAYNRFYSSIPREDYEKITGGRPNIDKFVQFFLNSLRDGNIGVDDAKAILDEYESSDPSVRQIIISRFREGEYEDPYDIGEAIENIKKTGITSRKKFAKDGLIKLKETDNWIMTCTINYEASNHYYGMTHWCTASDRDGDYDGYEMFKRYTIESNSSIVQIKSKTDDKKMYQMQVRKDGVVGQICDFEDNELYFQNLYNAINDNDFLSFPKQQSVSEKLYQLTVEMHEKEEKYQEAKETYRRKRVERRVQLSMLRKEEMEREVQAYNAQWKEKFNAFWEEVKENQLYKNLEFISKVYNYTAPDYELEEENAEECKYFCISEEAQIDNKNLEDGWGATGMGRRILSFSQVYGYMKSVEEDDDGAYYIAGYYDPCPMNRSHDSVGFYAICEFDEDNNIINICDGGSIVDNGVLSINTLYELTSQLRVSPSFLEIENYNGENCIYYKDINKFIPIGNCHVQKIMSSEDAFFFFSDDYCISDDDYYDVYINVIGISKSDGKILFYYPGARPIDCRNESDFIPYFIEVNGRQLVFIGERERENTAKSFWAPEGVDTFTTFTEYIKWEKEGKYNISPIFEPHKFIFDVWWPIGGVINYSVSRRFGHTVAFVSQLFGCPYLMNYSHEMLIYKDDADEFFLFYPYSIDTTLHKCNSKGEDEKAMIANRNFEKWKEQGGHSPEVKAQMDAMWDKDGINTRNNNSDKAMRDWNDADLFKDFDKREFVLNNDGENTPNWRGPIASKDPLDASRGYYKIGIDGNPIDQPWNDEDEIPAKLSESAKKMFNLIDRMKDL